MKVEKSIPNGPSSNLIALGSYPIRDDAGVEGMIGARLYDNGDVRQLRCISCPRREPENAVGIARIDSAPPLSSDWMPRRLGA